MQLGGDRGVIPPAGANVRGGAVTKAKAQSRAADLAPILAEIEAAGASSLRETAAALNERGIPADWGGSWSAVQVSRVLERTA